MKPTKLYIALPLLIVLTTWICLRNRMIVETSCDYQTAPLTASQVPHFSWKMKTGVMQLAYQIEVFDEQGNYCWQSGKQVSQQSQHLRYQGEALLPSQRYYWRVRVWEANRRSSWSTLSSFKVAPEQVQQGVSWIGAIRREDARLPEGRQYEGNQVNRDPDKKQAWRNTDTLSRRSLYLRKEFELKKRLHEATLYVAGLGHYELSLNGQRIGTSEFAPLWSDYDKTIYYNAYDLTSLLERKNAVGVLLGNGFYNVQGGRYRKLLVSFGPPTLFFRLTLRYADGTSEDIVSDASWKYAHSPILFNCIYGGEDYDARLEQPGWDVYGFDDSAWRPVVVQDAPKGQLRPQTAPPVRIKRRYQPISQAFRHLPFEKKKGQAMPTVLPNDSVYVFDMGQNLAGYPEIVVQGQPGDRIRLVVGESLGKDSVVNQSQSGKPHYYEYTLKSNRKETWHPRFSYYGFRYIRIEHAVPKNCPNPKQLPVIHSVQSCFVYNDAREVGHFESSNQLFNQIHLLIKNAVRSNMQAVFTDCPHREKLGWLEQLHLNGPGLLYNYDLSLLWPKIVQDMADEQYANGMVPSTAPMYVEFDRFWNDLPEWGSSLLILPFMYHHYYGDDSLIHRFYHEMRAYVDYLESTADHHIVSHGLGDWYDFGKERCGFAQNTPVALVATAHHYQNIKLLVRAAEITHRPDDVARYTALANEVLAAFQHEFFDEHTSSYATGSQTSLALPLYLDMVPDAHRSKVLNNLLADIEAKSFRLSTGEVGNRYLFQLLSREGLNEVMYKMHNHQEVPGYGYQLKFGATTLTEQWDPGQGASWNHFMLGAIDEWFFNTLGGIRIDDTQPGGQHLVIAPQVVGDMTWVKCSTETLYGQVKVDWRLRNGQFVLSLTLPANTRAKVWMPGESQPRELKSGRHRLKVPYSLTTNS